MYLIPAPSERNQPAGSWADPEESCGTGQGVASVFCEGGASKSKGKSASPKHYIMRFGVWFTLFSFSVVIVWHLSHVSDSSSSVLIPVAFLMLTLGNF